MSRPLLGAASRLAARVSASRFAKPGARVVLVAMGLACLAAIGRAAVAGSVATPAGALAAATPASADLPPAPISPPPRPSESPIAAAPAEPSAGAPAAATASPPTSRGPASPDDPVFLNSAGIDDLRRLPGIGEKRATAILALRARLGRLRAIEDLMKVKGIGRATMRRLRPLVRLDGPGDAGR
jgi:competence protein ComEA